VTFFDMPDAKVYRREIHSRLAEVDWLCTDMRALLASSDLDEARFAIELLAHESLCNAVIHGNKKNADKRVLLEIRVGRVWVRLQVTDEGNGFDWRKKSFLPGDVGDTTGRGIALYALYAERRQFNAFGNQVTLWIRKRKLEGEHNGRIRC
jgi:serine/threonine-protein kinase RsbW